MTKKVKIETIIDDKRISTQELLQLIYEKMEEGVTDFEINASGQHDIGGPLWSENGETLSFHVTNPGQRVGSMGMPGTKIVVEGSVPADAGWLNSGAEIIIKGDGGDTTAHCAAGGKIFVGGRVGTRSGALMKHDPKYIAPEFWVLKNTGSFAFEFMGGGTAVVCGLDCENMDSVLGNRSCVGMVGGTVYFRGKVKNVFDEVFIVDIDDSDKEFLKNGIAEFAEKIERPDIVEKLTNFDEWKKIIAPDFYHKPKKTRISVKDFKEKSWIKGGIFSDVYKDDFNVVPFVTKGDNRLRVPVWANSENCAPCEYDCPLGIPTQKRINLIKNDKLKEAIDLVLKYTPFPASVCGNVCPNLCMEHCNRQYVDEHIKVAELGVMSRDAIVPKNSVTKKEKIAIIGSGAAGLSCAWQLDKMGYQVEVFEADNKLGGKLSQVIPEERLANKVLQAEINRLKNTNVKFTLNKKITAEDFDKLQKDFDAVVIAVGAHVPFVIPFEGNERLVKGLNFLKSINNGEKVEIGEKVVIIGAGNAAMDVVIGAYKCGAKEVTAIDIQKPAAFPKEIAHAKSLGAKILWPCFTEKVTEQGVHLKDGTVLEADTVIISVGDRSDFAFLDKKYLDERGRLQLNEYKQLQGNDKVFAVGDTIKQGLFVNALADGKNVALNIDKLFNNEELSDFKKSPKLPRDRVYPQYYKTCRPTEVAQIEPYEEQKRCLSCGLCRDCQMCLNACPQKAIERFVDDEGNVKYYSNEDRCIGCGICAGICPCGIWTMKSNI